MAIHFFHVADIHLESPFKGIQELPTEWQERLRKASFEAFDAIIQDAENHSPDFIVLAGDLYDGENRSLRAQRHFQKAMERLAALQIPVYIIHGNHDHLGGRWTRFSLPPNVHVFPDKPTAAFFQTKDHKVQLAGFSYPTRHLTDSFIQHYPEREADVDFAIGLLHGSEQTQTEHDVYAPFTIDQLKAIGYDYWALGHIHKRQVIHENPSIVYSGTIQGRHRKETGQQGYYSVTLSHHQTTLDFCPVATTLFETTELELAETSSIEQLIETITSHLLQQQWGEQHVLVQVTLSTKRMNWLGATTDSELQEYIREQVTELLPTVYMTQLRFNWQNELSPYFQTLLESAEVVNPPAALRTYAQQESVQQLVKEKIQALLVQRSDQS